MSQTLADGARALGVDLGDDGAARLATYVDLLVRWNRVYNLTAVRDPDEIVTRHLLDSLVVSRFLRGESVVDVGTGAGLPGIPLAVANPDKRFVLLDANGKKTRFVLQAVGALGLANVAVERARCEDYRPTAGFDTVVARAFAPIPAMLKAAGHLCGDGGQVLVMKAGFPHDELAQLPSQWHLRGVSPLAVPGLNSSRHLVELVREGNA